jgi:hypothetical protein
VGLTHTFLQRPHTATWTHHQHPSFQMVAGAPCNTHELANPALNPAFKGTRGGLSPVPLQPHVKSQVNAFEITSSPDNFRFVPRTRYNPRGGQQRSERSGEVCATLLHRPCASRCYSLCDFPLGYFRCISRPWPQRHASMVTLHTCHTKTRLRSETCKIVGMDAPSVQMGRDSNGTTL